MDTKKYPNLVQVAKALLSSFHGPLDESSFSAMGDLMNENAGHMEDETYQTLQTIRFHLKAKGQTAVNAFKKEDPLREPVSKILCDRMKEAYKRREDRQEKKRQAAEEQR
jgi:hypothetical protein